MARCGIFYATKDAQGFRSEGNLSLVSKSLHTTIKATNLRTSLVQVFDHVSGENTLSCRYEFPLYDGISIVKFTCTMDSKKLSGVIHERAAATKIYEDAKNRGEIAGLLEQNSKASDVFSTSLGNIPAGKKVVVEIEYIGELTMEGGNRVKLTIPTKVAPRFGTSGSSSTSLGTTTKGGMKIIVDVLMWAGVRIDGLASPSHPVAITIGASSTGSEKRESYKASVTLAQESAALDRDFVLLINVKDLGDPKAVLETHSTISNHRALMVSLVPKFTLPAHNPEIVFVVDRSTSMRPSMSTLRSAMSVSLKSLPSGINFNICSFGTGYEFLWPVKTIYTRQSGPGSQACW
ncbi:deb11d08-1ab1-425d-92c2-3d024e49e611-CDS [Sclerotinia trifoliorum]|uniref:Deb11d08-1ab1-425d-92c2-3d024e49e611-CDS n=1 Tax=Sclerotinia trifoliorum TaxID=28548 RepID=A0A8H2W3Z3_9HELO|nr:deb11d08-1ab1-425d-92c2-3d024e49e611-CDS [Sclerotinia trifoliorum]